MNKYTERVENIVFLQKKESDLEEKLRERIEKLTEIFSTLSLSFSILSVSRVGKWEKEIRKRRFYF